MKTDKQEKICIIFLVISPDILNDFFKTVNIKYIINKYKKVKKYPIIHYINIKLKVFIKKDVP